MKKYMKQIIFFTVMIICILFQNKIYAAGGFVIGTSKSEISKGESFTLTISANNAYGQVNIQADNATVSPNTVFLENNTKTVTVTSTNSNDISIVVSPAKSGLGDQDENPITTAQGAKVKVKTTSSNNSSEKNNNTQTNQNTNNSQSNNTQTKSSVATLGNLGIKPNDFKGFTPSKISYSTTVPDNVSSIEIYATKGQSGQTISGTGKKQLKDGQNNFEIKVTAEDGKTTKTYKLTVTKGKSSSTSEENNTENTTSQDVEENNSIDENSSDTEAEEQTLGLAELKIDGITLSPSFKKDVYEYTAKLKEDKDKLDVIATPITDGNKVEILGNDNLKDGENTITIIVSDESGENTATYQINVTKEKKEKTFLEKIMEKKKECLIIGALCVAIIVVVIILIVYHVHSKNDMYSGMYMPYEDGVTQHEDIHKDEIRKESKHVETKRKSKGKRFK